MALAVADALVDAVAIAAAADAESAFAVAAAVPVACVSDELSASAAA